MKKILTIIICSLCCFSLAKVHAQVEGELPKTIQTNNYSSLEVFKDPRIDLLIQKQQYINMLRLRNISGYRVQVISTMDRQKATETKKRLMQLFPEYETYLTYQSPYFRVRIGDFLNRNKATELQKELSNYFPGGVFTVRDRVHVTIEKLLSQEDTSHVTSH
jgi:hypothetical protein